MGRSGAERSFWLPHLPASPAEEAALQTQPLPFRLHPTAWQNWASHHVAAHVGVSARHVRCQSGSNWEAGRAAKSLTEGKLPLLPPTPDPAYFLSSPFVSDFRNYAAKQSVGRRKRLKRAGIWQGKEQNSRAGLCWAGVAKADGSQGPVTSQDLGKPQGNSGSKPTPAQRSLVKRSRAVSPAASI